MESFKADRTMLVAFQKGALGLTVDCSEETTAKAVSVSDKLKGYCRLMFDNILELREYYLFTSSL